MAEALDAQSAIEMPNLEKAPGLITNKSAMSAKIHGSPFQLLFEY
jgi:hypothetical protein